MKSRKNKSKICELNLHIKIDADNFTATLVYDEDNGSVLSESKLSSECPACKKNFDINLVIHKNSIQNNDTTLEGVFLENIKVEPELSSTSPYPTDHHDYEASCSPRAVDFPKVEITSSKSPDRKKEIGEVIQHGVKSQKKHKMATRSNKRSRSISPIKSEVNDVSKDKNENGTEEIKNYCSACYQVFQSFEEKKQHTNLHDLDCKFCDNTKSYKSYSLLCTHVSKHHSKHHPLRHTFKTCPVCQEAFFSHKFQTHLDNCKGHLKEKVDEKPYCDICKKSYKSKKLLESHIQRIHEKAKEHKIFCDVCGDGFFDDFTFKKHCRDHGGRDLKFQCDLCKGPNNCFKTKGNLKAHIEFVHLKIPKKKLNCPECGKEILKNLFNTHMRRHKYGFKPFDCKICGKGFGKKSVLNRHLAMHLDLRPFPCSQCSSNFRTIQELKVHERLHSGEKPFSCEVCLKKFSDRSCYRTHLLKHERELGITLDKGIKKFKLGY